MRPRSSIPARVFSRLAPSSSPPLLAASKLESGSAVLFRFATSVHVQTGFGIADELDTVAVVRSEFRAVVPLPVSRFETQNPAIELGRQQLCLGLRPEAPLAICPARLEIEADRSRDTRALPEVEFDRREIVGLAL